MTKLTNSNCDKNSKSEEKKTRILTKLKTQIMTKLKISNCDKTQNYDNSKT